MEQMIELMAPAGSFESLQAAIKAGADSVYFGIKGLNMRSLGARNFELSDLPEIVETCRRADVRPYLTLNTVIYDDDELLMRKIADAALAAGIAAVIAMDMAPVLYCNSIGLEVHTSTQTNVSNVEAVKFFSRYADTIVLARELSLEQIKKICSQIRVQGIKGPRGDLVKIEVFIHGALCVSISGKCYMSLATYNKSANRGECLQNCRRKYRVVDDVTGAELVIDNNYVMSPKDLCTIRGLDRIIESGASVLKIEGRGRSPEYVYTVVKAYREAVDACLAGTFSVEKAQAWEDELASVFNRGFWHGGYYWGDKLGEWAGAYGSKATHRKVYVGDVANFYSRISVGEFDLKAGSIELGDRFLVTGPTTGVVEGTIESIHADHGPVERAEQGMVVSFPVPEKIRENDKLYVVRNKTRTAPE